jgi:nucleoside-diphosphate-sugar epimerase
MPVPDLAVDTAAEMVARLPRAPDSVAWIHAARRPVLMKVDRARKQLGWRPKHTSRATLKQLVAARRAAVPAVR